MNRKNNNRITIWTSIDLMVPCLKAKLRREFPSADENEITALMHSVNFRYFEDMKAKLDEVSIGKPIIVIASFSDPFNKDNCSNHVKVIDSGNLGECFDEDFDLAEWYIDENGDLCSYDVDREGFGNYVYCYASDIVRINKQLIPIHTVRKRLSMVTAEHIEYVISSLEKNKSKIKNMRAYLLTALYNSIDTMETYCLYGN